MIEIPDSLKVAMIKPLSNSLSIEILPNKIAIQDTSEPYTQINALPSPQLFSLSWGCMLVESQLELFNEFFNDTLGNGLKAFNLDMLFTPTRTFGKSVFSSDPSVVLLSKFSKSWRLELQTRSELV